VDRIDLHLEVPPVEIKDLLHQREAQGESSKELRQRVILARELQAKRYGSPLKLNAHLTPKEIKRYCKVEAGGETFLEKAVEKLGFSARALHKVLKVARTIADLANYEIIKKEHLAEALQYRILERKNYE